MKKYRSDKMIEKIHHGNNIEVLKQYPDNYFDSIVTDPPYGLGKEPSAVDVLSSWLKSGYHEVKGKGFMGKEWDAFVPQPNFWKEIYRVLKPGGYVLSFAGTRTYDWMVMAVRLAGFEIRDMIAWLYGSGFPKSHDISKAIDKRLGAEREVVGENKNIKNRKLRNIETMNVGAGAGNNANITIPSTDEAKQWEGWGTALKPALEPIVMARKPLDGTVAQNILKYGVGGINIDECRVGTEEITTNGSGKQENSWLPKSDKPLNTKHTGRFPANFIHDGSEEVEKLFPDSGGGTLTLNQDIKRQGMKEDGPSFNSKNSGFDVNKGQGLANYGDDGSASRFFYVAKASKEERNFGLYDFEEKHTASAEFRPNHMEKALKGE